MSSEIVWKDPPRKAAGLNGKKSIETRLFVEQVRANPGKWAMFPRKYKGASGANAAYYKMRYPDLEWVTRKEDGYTCIYARARGAHQERKETEL